MGLHIRLHNINCPNPFEVSYRIAPTPGDETVISTGYTQYGSTYDSSNVRNYYDNPIILSGSTFDDIFFETVWIKIQDTVTDGYIIENIKIHSESYYDNCLAVCDFSGGTASEVLITPTATPEPTSIDPTATPTPTPTSTPVGPTPTPTPTENCDFDVDINIVTATPTPTPTPTATDLEPVGISLQIYGRDVASTPQTVTMFYSINGGSNVNIPGATGVIMPISCSGIYTINGLSTGDTVEFGTSLLCVMTGASNTSSCPSSINNTTTYTHNVDITSTQQVAITIDTGTIP